MRWNIGSSLVVFGGGGEVQIVATAKQPLSCKQPHSRHVYNDLTIVDVFFKILNFFLYFQAHTKEDKIVQDLILVTLCYSSAKSRNTFFIFILSTSPSPPPAFSWLLAHTNYLLQYASKPQNVETSPVCWKTGQRDVVLKTQTIKHLIQNMGLWLY